MRGLAEFIMRGRWQALAVAALGAGSLLFGWISASAVALVTLRKGWTEGMWLTLWALLPAGLIAWFSGDSGSVLLLLGTFCLAATLRESVSLPLAVVVSVLVGFASGAALLLFSTEFLQQLVEVFNAVITQLEAGLQTDGAVEVSLDRPSTVQIAGMLAAGNSAMTVLSLLLGRYWQALLYNPGGFRREFHELRLPPHWTLGLTILALVLWFALPDYTGWAAVAAVPLMFCGFALVHARAAVAGQGTGWLTALYLLWLVIDPVKLALLGIVVIDAVLNFRGRWKNRREAGGE